MRAALDGGPLWLPPALSREISNAMLRLQQEFMPQPQIMPDHGDVISAHLK